MHKISKLSLVSFFVIFLMYQQDTKLRNVIV